MLIVQLAILEEWWALKVELRVDMEMGDRVENAKQPLTLWDQPRDVCDSESKLHD